MVRFALPFAASLLVACSGDSFEVGGSSDAAVDAVDSSIEDSSTPLEDAATALDAYRQDGANSETGYH